MDCADYFFSQRDPNLAIQVLSNVAELGLDDSRLPACWASAWPNGRLGPGGPHLGGRAANAA